MLVQYAGMVRARAGLGARDELGARGRPVWALAKGGVLLAMVAWISTAAQAADVRASSPSVASGAAATSDDVSSMEEVVVTARRRNENLERVPVSISAIGHQDLAERTIQTQSDLQSAVPGLTVRESQTENQLNFSLRGQSIDTYSGSSPAVLPYFDDFQFTTLSAGSIYDLESVQVLKGPQGTLFGRNATGGAVLYTTAKPKDELGGFVTLRGGNYDLGEVLGALDVPIVPGKVSLRVAFDIEHRNGFVRNVYNGQDLGKQERQSGRATLVVTPTEDIASTTVFQFNHAGGNNVGATLYSAYPCGATHNGQALVTTGTCLFGPTLDATVGAPGAWNAYLAAHPKAPPQGLYAYTQQARSMGPWVVDLDAPSSHYSRDFFLTNTTTFEVAHDMTVKNILGYGETKTRDLSDVDGGPYGVISLFSLNDGRSGQATDNRQGSEELQLLGKALDEKLDYIVGAFYSRQSNSTVNSNSYVYLQPIIDPSEGNYRWNIIDKSEAVFAQGTYDLQSLTTVAGLKVTAGIRYTWEQVGIQQLPGAVESGLPDENETFSAPSWTVGLEYQVNPNLLVYVEQRGSWRTGGFAGASPAVPATGEFGGNEFLPEKTHDVELGVKLQGDLAGMPGRFNVAVYNQWVTNIQRSTIVTIDAVSSAVTSNVPSATITGAELDAALDPTRWLSVGGNVAFTDARYTDGNVTLFGEALSYGPFADAPRWSGSLFAKVELTPLRRFGEMYVRADVYSQSKDYFSNLNDTVIPESSLPSYTTLNLRYDWNVADTKLTLSAFAKNVLDKKYYVGGLAFGNSFGFNNAVPGEPLMYGAEATYRF
jgi:iron complex outermembrane receptor protein